MDSRSVRTSPLPSSLALADPRLYLVTCALVLGNVLLPWALHRIPDGGRSFLPILFFTLVAGWRFGARAGVLTGLLSPLANHLLTGMPPAALLQGLVLQSVLLGLLAGWACSRRPTLPALAALVLVHQALCLLPVALQSGLGGAAQILRLHLPAILLQVLGGAGVLRLLRRPSHGA
jgi:hypothetical protein